MATIVVGTNSYVTEAELIAYAAEYDVVFSGNIEAISKRALDYIDLDHTFSGSKTDEDQDLEFPRNGDTDVPYKVQRAQMEAAILIDEGTDFFATETQSIKSEKIDVLETVYQDGTSSNTVTYPKVDKLLAPYLANTAGANVLNLSISRAY